MNQVNIEELLEKNRQLSADRAAMKKEVADSKITVNKLVEDVTKALHRNDGSPNPDELKV